MDNMIYENFLNHLRVCNGCTGERSVERCQYAVVCATAERLGEKGVVRSGMELRKYRRERNEHNG